MKPLAGPGATPSSAGQPGVADLAERIPDLRGLEAAPVGVVQQEHVERVGADPLEAALGGHPHVVAIALRTAQLRIGEARKPLRPLALARIEVMADRSHQRVLGPANPGQRAPQQEVGLPGAVGVGAQKRPYPAAGAQERLEALVGERLPEAHEAPAAPGAHGDMAEHGLTLVSVS